MSDIPPATCFRQIAAVLDRCDELGISVSDMWFSEWEVCVWLGGGDYPSNGVAVTCKSGGTHYSLKRNRRRTMGSGGVATWTDSVGEERELTKDSWAVIQMHLEAE